MAALFPQCGFSFENANKGVPMFNLSCLPSLYHIPDSIYGYEREFGVILPLIRRHPCNDHICLKPHCHFCFSLLLLFNLYFLPSFFYSFYLFVIFYSKWVFNCPINVFIKCITNLDFEHMKELLIQHGDSFDHLIIIGRQTILKPLCGCN